MRPVRVLVTGGNGFVGRSLMAHLQQSASPPFEVLGASRQPDHHEGSVQWVQMPNLAGAAAADFAHLFAEHAVDVVVHLAARVHVMHEQAADPLQAFRAVNVTGSLALAQAAAAHGVRRFVYVSSIKVHGESTQPGQPFDAAQTPDPQDAYGVSKWEAEQALADLAQKTGLELVVVRPPLIYGPGVKANLAALAQWVSTGLPVPFGRITHNRRSLVGVDNLCSCLLQCVTHPNAAGQTLLVSDGQDLSTADLCHGLANALGRQAWMLGVPLRWLEWLAKFPKAGPALQRLMGSLQVDIKHTRTTLDWTPPVTVQEGLNRAFKP